MKRPVRVSEEAEVEATEAARWYDARRLGLGDEFLTVLDEVLADWAEAYGEQTVKEHTALLRAIKSGRVKAVGEL